MELNYTLSTPISTTTISTTIISTTISTTTSNMTNNSYSYQDTSSDSGLAASYIALIITLIGLFSTLIVHYNIKRVKICCLKIECNKKKNSEESEPSEFKLPDSEDKHSDQHSSNDKQIIYIVHTHSETIV